MRQLLWGAPGYVWVSDEEIEAMAERLGLDNEAFRRRYTRRVGKRGISLQRSRSQRTVLLCVLRTWNGLHVV